MLLNLQTGVWSYPYQHRWIAQVIQDQFFTNAESLGMEMEGLFNPIPAKFMALLYTLVSCILTYVIIF